MGLASGLIGGEGEKMPCTAAMIGHYEVRHPLPADLHEAVPDRHRLCWTDFLFLARTRHCPPRKMPRLGLAAHRGSQAVSLADAGAEI